jgi:AAA domain
VRELAAKRAGLPLQTLDVFLSEPEAPMVWLVDRLLPVGGLSELVAKPKVGKSTLARCLAAAIAQGQPFLGRDTQAGPVIYCAFEERRHEVRNHFRQLGLTGDEPIHVLIGATPQDFLARLRVSIAELRPVLAVIDPLIRVTRVRDLSEYASVAQALEPVADLARETNTHLQLIHHGRKSEGEGGDVSLGSTAIFAAVDIGLFLRKTPGGHGGRLISTVQRYGDGLDAERALVLDLETGWVTIGHTQQESAELEMQDVIAKWLRDQPEAVEEKAILEDVEGRRGTKVVALRRLAAAGRVLRTGAGGPKDPYRYRGA